MRIGTRRDRKSEKTSRCHTHNGQVQITQVKKEQEDIRMVTRHVRSYCRDEEPDHLRSPTTWKCRLVHGADVRAHRKRGLWQECHSFGSDDCVGCGATL